MAGKQKHAERSHRSYRQKKANMQSHSAKNVWRQTTKQAMTNPGFGGLLKNLFKKKKKADK